jgi:hypothetical protein
MITVAVAVVAIETIPPIVIIPAETIVTVAKIGCGPVGIPQGKIKTVVEIGVGVITPVERVIPAPVIGVAVAEPYGKIAAPVTRAQVEIIYRPPGVKAGTGVTV